MDAVKAELLERQLRGATVGTYEIRRLLNHGKSAAVFEGTRRAETVAVKIFDDEIIERYGDKTQLERINRELDLVGKSHPNLVKILDGGVDHHTSNHYIVMEYLNGPNLKACLTDVPADSLPELIEQLAKAARFLEDLGLCHRDIKPENIVVLDGFRRLVLLDLGVLRPIGQPGLTDGDGILSFVGTLQYSSPEFLLRGEEDSPEGWRALTFYQIGGVLHDLIMRRPLFEEFINPYARLVNAVQHEVPLIQNSAVPQYLVELAGACLLKKPGLRLRLVQWDSFFRREMAEQSGESAKQRVTNRAALERARLSDEEGAPEQQDGSAEEVLESALSYLKEAIRSIRNDNVIFPPVNVSKQSKSRLKVYFRPSPSHSLPHGLTLLVAADILDVRARVLSLTLVAFIGGRPSEQPKISPRVFFEGIYDTVKIYEKFEEVAYRALDGAQRSRLAASDDSATGRWIDLEENEENHGSDVVD